MNRDLISRVRRRLTIKKKKRDEEWRLVLCCDARPYYAIYVDFNAMKLLLSKISPPRRDDVPEWRSTIGGYKRICFYYAVFISRG